ncbi:hypothetical protein F2Q68_00016993 [Brassica cretica]|uniref:Uncharacterized protein n=1 Tax=Brassica cretica TaxID=69181 RepID=A0A8S9HQN6_BRACR|nr:hypothetical protein F2Q68_00016993 [Brassica cretica]
MVNSSILLADLKAGSCSNTVKVRLIRFGEARIVKNGGHWSTPQGEGGMYGIDVAGSTFHYEDIMGEVSCINTVFDNENHFIHHNNPIRQVPDGLHCSFLESMVREPPVYEVPECPPVTRRRDHDEAF